MKGVISRAAVPVAALLIVCGLIGMCFAVTTSSGEKKFRTGGVSITLDVFTESPSGIESAAPKSRVLNSTDNISYIPRITNHGEDSYVRIKFLAGDMNISHLCRNLGEKWILKGDYLYRTEAVSKNETAEVCRELELSDELEKILSFEVEARADCIQAANFKPDFSSDMPWGNVAVQSSMIDENYSIYRVAPSEREGIRLVFEGDAEKLAVNRDTFLAGFGELMPGDSIDDSLVFSGKGRGDVYFRAEGEKNSLTEKMMLTITAEGREYYSGPVYGDRISEYSRILRLDGENRSIGFRISVPEELDDDYQRIIGETTFFFKVIGEEENQPATGDISILLPVIVAAALSAAGTAAAIRRRRR
ncbi:MAG: hypothetical protein ACI4LK_05125 [Lentihominibacter sp.]